MVLFYRCGGVSLAVRGCGLNRFLPPIILNVCVCVRKRACVNVDMSMYCPFKFQNAHSHSHTHTHAYCQNWHSLFVALPTMTTSSNVKNFFFFSFFPFVFGVALFYTCTFYLLFFLVFTRWWNTTELYVLPQIGTSHTAKRYSCGEKKGDLNKHKLNLRFVPNCFMMFSIWHLSKLLYMRGTFIVRDCLCVWAIIF